MVIGLFSAGNSFSDFHKVQSKKGPAMFRCSSRPLVLESSYILLQTYLDAHTIICVAIVDPSTATKMLQVQIYVRSVTSDMIIFSNCAMNISVMTTCFYSCN